MIIAAAEQGHNDHIATLLDEHDELLASQGPRIANEVLTWSEQQAPETTVPYGPLIRLAAYLDEQEQVRLGELVASRIEGGGPGATEALGDFDRSTPAFGVALERIIERLVGHPQFDGAAQSLLVGIAPHLDEISDDEQERLVRHLQAWMTATPASAGGIASAIQTMLGLRAKAAEPLVGALIDTSRQIEAGVNPAELLIAAGRVSGASNTRASKRLHKYLRDELGKGSEDDQSLAAQVTQALNEQ